MTVATLDKPGPTPKPAALVPGMFPTDRMVTPEGNPVYTPDMVADLVASFPALGQLNPGWICPSPKLEPDQRLVLEGNRRLAACRLLGRPFLAFDLGRFVDEPERIRLSVAHNHSRRVMPRDELRALASRWMELTGSSAAQAAEHLNISPPTLSRILGERRIPPELRERAERLGPSICSVIASVPPALMAKALEYAETPDDSGKKRTRDQVSAFNQRLKATGQSGQRGRKPKSITLTINGRSVTFSVSDGDGAASVGKDLTAIVARLGKLDGVPPAGWTYHFS